jgi:hypothetical protein
MHRQSIHVRSCVILAATVSMVAGQSAFAGLSHRYSFNGNVNDSVGTANGTIVDAGVPTATFTGGQLDLSANTGQGSNNITEDAYVNFPNGLISSTATSGSGALSLELWATVSATHTWQRYIDFGTSDGGEDASGGGGASGYVYISPNSGRWNNGLATETHEPNGPANEVGQNGPLPNNLQIHVVGTYDHNDLSAGANGTIKLYRDGALIGTAAIATNLNLRTFTDNNNWLGRSQWPDPVFDGLVNEFRIYNHALTATEVTNDATFGPDVVNPGGTLSLQVNKTTGAVTLVNSASAPLSLEFYRISSAGGALSTVNWNSLDDQNISALDGTDAGTVEGDSPGEGWDEAGGSSANQLVEEFLRSAGSTIAANSSISLGNAFNTAIFGAGNNGDLQFQFGVNNGALITGTVSYVTGGPAGDYDGDGDVDGADFLVWQRGFGSTHTAATLATWKANFGAHGTAAAGTVPEPTSMALVFGIGLLLASWRRQPCR